MTSIFRSIRVVFCVVIGWSAWSASAASYAVLSLVGDRLETVITKYDAAAGLERTARQSVPIESPVFDQAAAQIAAQAIKRAEAAAELAVLNTRGSALFDRQFELFTLRGATMVMPEAIRNAAKQMGAGRLVLIGKRRMDVEFPTASGRLNAVGSLEGLGFHIDVPRSSGETTARDTTFAPFASLGVWIVDVADGRVIGSAAIDPVVSVAAARGLPSSGRPWSEVTDTDKLKLVQAMLERELPTVVQRALSAR